MPPVPPRAKRIAGWPPAPVPALSALATVCLDFLSPLPFQKPVPLRVGLRARLRPMKLPSFLLVGSLVANAVLLTWWLAPDRASPALTAHNSSTRAPATAAPSLTPRAAPSALTPAALREHLTSLGLPPAAVTALVRARLYAPHDARRRELLTAASQSLPWWKFAKRPPSYDSSIHLTPAARKELHDLEAEARAATLATLGPVPLDPTGSIAARYAFLSPEKAVLLDALEQDYRNLNSELRDELGRVRTTADREREKLLETERQRDLAVLLSPAEREILDQRTSPTATRLASRMLAFQATEEEYRALYAIQKSFEQTSALLANPAHGSRVPSIDSQPEFTKQIRAALGETRFADWESSTQTHVQALAQLAVVNNLPPTAVREVNALLTAAAASSWTLVTDDARPPAERTAALAQLAADTRAHVAAKLGPDVTEKYLRDVFWIDLMANGGGVQLTGGSISMRSIAPITRPAAPPAPTTPGK